MKVPIFILIFFISIGSLWPFIPFSNAPSWTSSDNDFSTGGALYDFTMDGWIDTQIRTKSV